MSQCPYCSNPYLAIVPNRIGGFQVWCDVCDAKGPVKTTKDNALKTFCNPAIHLQKFLPGSDLPDGRYLMDHYRYISVVHGRVFFLDELNTKKIISLRDFWAWHKKSIEGVLPLEGEEGA